MKRLFDIVVSGAALVLCAPLLLGVACTVVFSDGGPALFASPRLGRGGRVFRMLKFRTMQVGAPDLRNADGSTYAGHDDPRVTAVGRWLRRTSLDELPQLVNVLRGDMSLVGPRPDLPDQIAHYQPADHQRLTVRPGMTGLAQITGRNDLPWAERRALDLQYVQTRTFRRDLQILALTIPRVLASRGIYSPIRGESHGESRHR